MKSFGKMTAALLLTGSIALTGCQAVNDDKGTATTETATASATATPIATPAPAVPAPVDFTNPNPMGQDVALLNANTTTPEVYGFYTQEQFHEASTLGLNLIEQVMAVPSMFDNSRDVLQDGVRLQNFFSVFDDETNRLIKEHIATKGAVNMFPFPDKDGKIPSTQDDGTPSFMPLKWDNKAPETKWNEVTTYSETLEGGQHIIMVSALGEHAAINDKGEDQTLNLRYRAMVYPDASGAWKIYSYKWTFESCTGCQ